MSKSRDKTGSTQHELVQCDLEFSGFQEQLADLEPREIAQLFASVEKIERMTWQQIYNTSSRGAGKRGLNWEMIPGQTTKSGNPIASIRLTNKCRARVTRDGVFMCFISLHPDHDSAYTARGGEDIG